MKAGAENRAVPLLCSGRDAGGHADCLVWGHSWLMQGFDAGCDSTRAEFESLQIQSTAKNEGELSQKGSRRSVSWACEVASLHLSTHLHRSAQSTSSLFKPFGHQMSFICCPSLLTGTAPIERVGHRH